MITVMSQPIAGESYESMVQRLSARAFPTHRRPLWMDKLGKRSARIIPPGELVSRLAVPEWLPIDQLLEEFTTLPIQRPFLNPSDERTLIERLKTGVQHTNESDLLANAPRFCEICRRTEFEAIAESGWHGLHQMRWMTRCLGHKTPLCEASAKSSVLDFTVQGIHVFTGCTSRRDLTFLNGVEKDTVWLAGARVPALGRLRWRDFHRAALTKRFGIQPPYLRRELFRIAQKVPRRVARWLQLPIVSPVDHWLETTILRQNGITKPLFHLCTLRLCGISVREAVASLLYEHSLAAGTKTTRDLLDSGQVEFTPEFNFTDDKLINRTPTCHSHQKLQSLRTS